MNYTHAPEPWAISSDGNLYGDGMYIGNISDDHNDEQTEANRALICAAPEMLDALQAVCDAYGDRDTLLMAQVKAALAKAKGGAA
jgi:hypothetical protein